MLAARHAPPVRSSAPRATASGDDVARAAAVGSSAAVVRTGQRHTYVARRGGRHELIADVGRHGDARHAAAGAGDGQPVCGARVRTVGWLGEVDEGREDQGELVGVVAGLRHETYDAWAVRVADHDYAAAPGAERCGRPDDGWVPPCGHRDGRRGDTPAPGLHGRVGDQRAGLWAARSSTASGSRWPKGRASPVNTTATDSRSWPPRAAPLGAKAGHADTASAHTRRRLFFCCRWSDGFATSRAV